MSNKTLHEEDFHAWALDQAARLRALVGSQHPELVGIDFENLAEELESMARGAEQWQVIVSLSLALQYIIKIAVLPDSEASLVSTSGEGRVLLSRPSTNTCLS